MLGQTRKPGFQTFVHASNFTHFCVNNNLQDTYPSTMVWNVRDTCLNNGGFQYWSRFEELELFRPNSYRFVSKSSSINMSFVIILTVTEGMNLSYCTTLFVGG